MKEDFAQAHAKEPFPMAVVSFEGTNGQEIALQARSLKKNCR